MGEGLGGRVLAVVVADALVLLLGLLGLGLGCRRRLGGFAVRLLLLLLLVGEHGRLRQESRGFLLGGDSRSLRLRLQPPGLRLVSLARSHRVLVPLHKLAKVDGALQRRVHVLLRGGRVQQGDERILRRVIQPSLSAKVPLGVGVEIRVRLPGEGLPVPSLANLRAVLLEKSRG